MTFMRSNKDSHDHRLPPLTGLTAFEAAARNLSFKLASEELSITPTAVSHRIKTLEDWLGLKLFHRLTRAVSLTKEGEALAPHLTEAFRGLKHAVDDVRQSAGNSELVISTTMSLASNWLVPLMPGFINRPDGACIRVEGTDALADLEKSNVDAAIRFGINDVDDSDLFAEKLFSDFVTPVCSPDLAAQIERPDDLLDLPRVAYEWSGFSESDPSWEKWFAAAGLKRSGAPAQTIVSDEHMALSQAIAGKAVALVGSVAAGAMFADGRLTAPLPVVLENRAYYFVCPRCSLRKRNVMAFRNWLFDEACTFTNSLEAKVSGRFQRALPVSCDRKSRQSLSV